MIKVTFITLGKLKEKYLREAVSEYEKRLSAYCKLSTLELKSDDGLLPALSDRSYKIALCVEGKQMSSEKFAEMLSGCTVNGVSHMVFVIGGSMGLSDTIKNMSEVKLSFSEMTFPHMLMRVILLEQIYRGMAIINNATYHK